VTNKLEQALAFDALSHAEDITGKSYKADEATSMLGMSMFFAHNEMKAALLTEANDSRFGQTLSEFIAFLEGMGFTQVLCEDIPTTEDKYFIFWRDGVLVSFDSYSKNRVNGGTAYLAFKGPREAIFQSSNGLMCEIDGERVWGVSFDVREGMRFRLDRLTEAGSILPVWPEAQWLWLLHYMDSKGVGYDHKAITTDRASKLPEHVRASIKVKP
jgi:hypothetical protein